MFGNALFNPSNTPYASPRRHSHLDVSIAPRLSQRRSTMPMIDVSGMSPGLGSMMGTPYSSRGPHTPCFVTPTLGGFSGRRFSYDSPLQSIQTLSSAGLPTLNKKAAKRAWAKMSTKKWSRSCKITAILLLCSFAVTLFLVRKMKESSVTLRHASCNDETGTCEASEVHHHENNPKENFMELVSPNDNHDHYLEEEPSDLWVNRWGVQDIEETLDTQLDTSNESEVNVMEQEPLGIEDLPSKMMDYVESVKTFIRDKISGGDSKDVVESAADPVEDSLNTKEISPSKSVKEPTPVQQTQVPVEMQKHHVHVLDGVTSYHGNTHYHAVWGEEPMQAPVKPSQMLPSHQQPQSGPMHQPGLPQPPTGDLHVPISGAPSQMNGIPAQPSHHRPQQGYGVPPAPGMPQQYHNQHAPGMSQQFHGQHAPGMMPQHGHQVAPGVNPVRYNQQYHQPQYHHNQGGIIGHNPPHHNSHQNNGKRVPPGVNPHRYIGL